MKVLTDKDYKLFEKLVSLKQSELRKVMIQYLKTKYRRVLITKDYIVAVGEIPIALVAHMDTVFQKPVENLYYDARKGVLWSPEGLGADDRAGVFAILKILQSGLRPSVIFTVDEEKGGLGAAALSEITCPIPNLKYMIELDRRGTNDCVFYDCYVPEFIDYVESFGFCEQWGSFSDISYLMPGWEICGVNLSVGYEDEHSAVETLRINPLFDTIKKVKKMLQEEDIPTFRYDSAPIGYKYWDFYRGYPGDGSWMYQADGQHCSCCKKLFLEYDLFPVKTSNGTFKYLCTDCMVDKVNWCVQCGDPYEKRSEEDNLEETLCDNCAEDLCHTKKLKINSKM